MTLVGIDSALSAAGDAEAVCLAKSCGIAVLAASTLMETDGDAAWGCAMSEADTTVGSFSEALELLLAFPSSGLVDGRGWAAATSAKAAAEGRSKSGTSSDAVLAAVAGSADCSAASCAVVKFPVGNVCGSD